MIVVVGSNGVAGWMLRERRNAFRRLVCLNDQFTIDLESSGPRNLRTALVAMLAHSEVLNGRTLSVGELQSLS